MLFILPEEFVERDAQCFADGDTEVEVCRYHTDEEEEEFREEVEDELDVDTIIDKLKEDKHFRESIQDMIKYVVWNRDVEV